MDLKPSEFYIRVTDFFAVLVPGSAGVLFIALDHPELVKPIQAMGDTQYWVAFLILAYLTGHVIYMAGAYLDHVYHLLRKRIQSTKEDNRTYVSAVIVQREASGPKFGIRFSLFKWCVAYIRLRAPEIASQIDAEEAISKFFRSLVVFFTLGIVYYMFRNFGQSLDWRVLVVLACLAFLCFLRYYNLRFNANELAFANAILVRQKETQKRK